MTDRRTRLDAWTGRRELDLRNGRDWAIHPLEIDVRRDTIEVRHIGRMLATMDRDQFREWMIHPHGLPFVADYTYWTIEAGLTVVIVRPGAIVYTVGAESLANLLTVI